jgi:hypothetical protein
MQNLLMDINSKDYSSSTSFVKDNFNNYPLYLENGEILSGKTGFQINNIASQRILTNTNPLSLENNNLIQSKLNQLLYSDLWMIFIIKNTSSKHDFIRTVNGYDLQVLSSNNENPGGFNQYLGCYIVQSRQSETYLSSLLSLPSPIFGLKFDYKKDQIYVIGMNNKISNNGIISSKIEIYSKGKKYKLRSSFVFLGGLPTRLSFLNGASYNNSPFLGSMIRMGIYPKSWIQKFINQYL